MAGLLAWGGEPWAAPGVELARPESESPPEPPKPQDPLWASIPGGSFAMGSDEYDDERPVHTVRLSPFRLMRTPVTRKQYQAIMGEDPGWPKGEADGRPVNQVSWLGAVAFCNRWSEAEGLTPCYRITGDKVEWEAEADGYRLPTEAEWEYACRAGSAARWCFGDDEAGLADYAWYGKNSGGEPRPVATRKPNAWGLHDMHGNVWEWCWDRYGPYDAAGQHDPAGPREGSLCVLRGGSFLCRPGYLRSADRYGGRPEDQYGDVGIVAVTDENRSHGFPSKSGRGARLALCYRKSLLYFRLANKRVAFWAAALIV